MALTCEDGALGDLGPEVEVLLRVLEEVDKLHDLNLGLLTACHVPEGHVDLGGVDQLGGGLAHAAHGTEHAAWREDKTPYYSNNSRGRVDPPFLLGFKKTGKSVILYVLFVNSLSVRDYFPRFREQFLPFKNHLFARPK